MSSYQSVRFDAGSLVAFSRPECKKMSTESRDFDALPRASTRPFFKLTHYLADPHIDQSIVMTIMRDYGHRDRTNSARDRSFRL